MDDLTPPVDTPVAVAASPLPAELATAVRYLMVAMGGVFVSKGWLSDVELNAIVGALLIVGPAIYGVILSRRNQAKQVTMANMLPDSVAKVG